MSKSRNLIGGLTLLLGVSAATPPRAAAQDPGLVVRYPQPGQRIAPDSNFLFGSLGDDGGTLEINGSRVPVEQNGAFLAWLPVPAPERGDTAFYYLFARRGDDTASVRLPILRPRMAPPREAASPWIDDRALDRQPERWIRPGEDLELEVTGEEGAVVRLVAGELRVPLEDTGTDRGSLHTYAIETDLVMLRHAACRAGRCRAGTSRPSGGPRPSAGAPEEPPDPAHPGGAPVVALDTLALAIVAEKEGRTTRVPFRLPLAILVDGAPGAVRLLETEDPVNGRSGVVVGRPTAFGPYRWRFPDGTVARVTGRVGPRLRVRLTDGLEAWVADEDTRWAPDQETRDPARAWDARAEPAPDGSVDFRLGVSRAVPVDVAVTGPRSLALTLFDTFGEITRIAHGTGTGVESVRWSQEPGPALRIELSFAWPVWGHRVAFEPGDPRAYEGPRAGTDPGAASGLVLRLAIRRPPEIDSHEPLEGRRIAVDPGHPGAGSYGPTGLYEGDANLAIARRLVDLLDDAGAEPILIRPDREALGLYERTRRARERGAELFVSIHNNALPDGIRPGERAGTGTYYYHPHSAALARAVQSGMVRHMGLPDLGVLWGDLAVAREPWMPAVLAEGAFMMIPSHEAALRTDEFRERYARGVLEGIEEFLAGTAADLAGRESGAEDR